LRILLELVMLYGGDMITFRIIETRIQALESECAWVADLPRSGFLRDIQILHSLHEFNGIEGCFSWNKMAEVLRQGGFRVGAAHAEHRSKIGSDRSLRVVTGFLEGSIDLSFCELDIGDERWINPDDPRVVI
jgi:hypothetical protein